MQQNGRGEKSKDIGAFRELEALVKARRRPDDESLTHGPAGVKLASLLGSRLSDDVLTQRCDREAPSGSDDTLQVARLYGTVGDT